MFWTHAVLFALFASVAQADKILRFSCSQLVTQRLDPVVQPGKTPSQHIHQIVGGDAFNVTMDPKTLDIPAEASCTTCTFPEDLSNYWTPAMFFRARNGTFIRVPQMANQGFNGANGGMTVYYTTPDDSSVNITAFAPGFRMVVGDPTKRTQSFDGARNSYRCYTGTNFDPNPFGVSANDTDTFPKQYCAGGVRVAIFFPTCWDGKNLDSANHKSHVAFGYSGCPSTHPVRLPQVFFETVWNTAIFPQSEWPEDGSQPFVWAQGDATGYGHHADYVFGWKGDSLQRAMDARCDFMGCKELKTQTFAAGNKCIQEPIVKEPLDGWLEALPGNMTVTFA
ncbi:Nn.00g004210.m01.CDS01 [Neocucurbitaria sp. VM-36]